MCAPTLMSPCSKRWCTWQSLLLILAVVAWHRDSPPFTVGTRWRCLDQTTPPHAYHDHKKLLRILMMSSPTVLCLVLQPLLRRALIPLLYDYGGPTQGFTHDTWNALCIVHDSNSLNYMVTLLMAFGMGKSSKLQKESLNFGASLLLTYLSLCFVFLRWTQSLAFCPLLYRAYWPDKCKLSMLWLSGPSLNFIIWISWWKDKT